MTDLPIGLQPYSVRGECQKDLRATIDAVARLGYRAVEPEESPRLELVV